MIRRDMPVHDRKPSKRVGFTTGGVRRCQLDGCPGIRVGVRWPDGRMTWPCTEGMDQDKGELFIR
jgi:hypothetical protein